MVILQIVDGIAQVFDVVSKKAEPNIAGGTKKAPHMAVVMVVVDDEFGISA